MYKIEEENTYEVLEQAYELARMHYYEVEEKGDKIPFNLNLDMMKQLLDMNLLFVVTARVDGKLVGYFANLVSPDIFTGKFISKELGIYVREDHRGSTAFARMLKRVEACCLEKGVYSQLLSFKKGHDTGLAERCGYDLTETVYQKILEV